MAPVTASVQAKYEGRINFVILDVRNSADRAMAKRLGMEFTPLYVFLDKDGNEKGRLEGAGWTLQDFDALLKKAGAAD